MIPVTFYFTKEVTYERAGGMLSKRISGDLDILDKAIGHIESGDSEKALKYLKVVRKIEANELNLVVLELERGYLKNYPSQRLSLNKSTSHLAEE